MSSVPVYKNIFNREFNYSWVVGSNMVKYIRIIYIWIFFSNTFAWLLEIPEKVLSTIQNYFIGTISYKNLKRNNSNKQTNFFVNSLIGEVENSSRERALVAQRLDTGFLTVRSRIRFPPGSVGAHCWRVPNRTKQLSSAPASFRLSTLRIIGEFIIENSNQIRCYLQKKFLTDWVLDLVYARARACN